MPEATVTGLARYTREFREHSELLSLVEEQCSGPLARLAEMSAAALAGGGKLLFFGNGGSAADAQHLAAELTVRFIRDRRALSGLALTTDSSVLTSCANDLAFQEIFSRQIEALGRPGDVAIAFSTSGKSPNVLRALEKARELQITAAGFAGCDGGHMAGLADPLVLVPCRTTARVQEMHILLGHLLCGDIESRLGLA